MTTDVSRRLLVTFSIAPEKQAEFNQWYNVEHIAPRLGMTGDERFRGGQRFAVTNGAASYLNVYDLDAGVLESEEYLGLRRAESAMPAATAHKKHLSTAYPEHFRRLPLTRVDTLAHQKPSSRRADALIVDIVQQKYTSALSLWTRNTLRALLESNPMVTSSSVWEVDDKESFAILTHVYLAETYDWATAYQGVLGWLPPQEVDALARETVVGHEIGRFSSPDRVTSSDDTP